MSRGILTSMGRGFVMMLAAHLMIMFQLGVLCYLTYYAYRRKP